MSTDNNDNVIDMQNEINIVFGSRIKMLREEKGLSPVDLAGVLGCTEEMYLDYEAGKGFVYKKTLIKLHDFYHVSCDFLVGLTDIRIPYPTPGDKQYQS